LTNILYIKERATRSQEIILSHIFEIVNYAHWNCFPIFLPLSRLSGSKLILWGFHTTLYSSLLWLLKSCAAFRLHKIHFGIMAKTAGRKVLGTVLTGM